MKIKMSGHTALASSIFVVSIAVFFLIAKGAPAHPDDFEQFDLLAKLDIDGELICQELVSTRMVKKTSSSNDLYEEDVLDFIYQRGYLFKQCSVELESMVDSYERNLGEHAGNLYQLTSYDISKSKALCPEAYADALKAFNSKYELPTTKNKFITLNENGVMIDPSRIERIEFDSKDALFYTMTIFLVPSGGEVGVSYSLYYGDEDSWQKAMSDISTAASQGVRL